MSDPESAEGSRSFIGRSENRADYQNAFIRGIHQLLQLAYESLDSASYASAEEDDITGDLCRHMRHLTEVEPTARWMQYYSVHDQDPSNDVISPKTGKARKGKRRPKIDIRLVCKRSIPNKAFCIEAKRLYRSDSVSQYVNEEGIGAFICGEYAKNDDCGGMLGYIQFESLDYWLPRIQSKLSTGVPKDARQLKRVKFKDGPEECFQTIHRRDDGHAICLFHVMFSFSSIY